MNCILVSAFVDWRIDCKNMHRMSNIYIIPMYENSDFLICFSAVFTLPNLHVFFVLDGREVDLWTGSVFYLKIQKLLRHLTAVRIHENVHFPICHSETFGVKN